MSGEVPHIYILVLQEEKKNDNKKHKFINMPNIY